MSGRRLARAVAGALFLLSLLAGLLVYGRFFLAYFSLPVPQLSLSGQLTLPPLDAGVNGVAQGPLLVIDKLGLQAPIVPDVPLDDQASYDKALQSGVALARGSAGLADLSGNSFLFGHSSRLSLLPTPYDTVFAGLPRLAPDDTIRVVADGHATVYRVTRSQQVDPSEVGYLASGDSRQLTLATCYPLGTNLHRWLVQASKVE